MLTCDRCGQSSGAMCSPDGVVPQPDWIGYDAAFEAEFRSMFPEQDMPVLLCEKCMPLVAAVPGRTNQP